MFKKLNIILNYVIGSFIGVFIGHSIHQYFHYIKHPGLYEIQSAPWYASVQIYALATGVVVLISIIIKLLIRRKLRNM